MKYGLLYYKDTGNIGDDIQSYAAEQFLPKIDYMIDRESLEKFSPNKKEWVSVIMNAWYIHDGLNFNFSPYIRPLFVSMHLKYFETYRGTTIGSDYINNPVKKKFLKYSPIGVRDMHTKKILDKLDIPNYFSGCLTLTLNKFKDVKKGNYIVTVGLIEEEIEYIKKNTNQKVINIIQDIPKGSLNELTWDKRRENVEKILKTYQGASMVITSKLHCSLPCLALEVPVLLLYDSESQDIKNRIGAYKKYLNHIDRKKFLNTKIDFNNIRENPKEYLKLRKELIIKCKTFINNTEKKESNNDLINPKIYTELINDQREIRNVIIKHFNILSEKYINEYWQYRDELNQYKYKINELENTLNTITNSRGWILLEKLRKIKKKLRKNKSN